MFSRTILSSLLALCWLCVSQAYGQELPLLELERLIHVSTTHLQGHALHDVFGDIKKVEESDSALNLDPARLKALKDHLQSADGAFPALLRANLLWRDGKLLEAQRKWFHVACSYRKSGVAFAALDNLKTSLIEQGRSNEALLPLVLILIPPTPTSEHPLTTSSKGLKRNACLVLSDYCLDQGDFSGAHFFLRLARRYRHVEGDCINYDLNLECDLEQREKTVAASINRYRGVKWID